jgi:hypothetical protein
MFQDEVSRIPVDSSQLWRCTWAWPAVLSQLADSLEAGLAFPAGVALVADAGPEALRSDFVAFRTRLRGTDLSSALDGLRRPGERTADSVVLLLRAALVELPTGGLAPVLRELTGVLSERHEARKGTITSREYQHRSGDPRAHSHSDTPRYWRLLAGLPRRIQNRRRNRRLGRMRCPDLRLLPAYASPRPRARAAQHPT